MNETELLAKRKKCEDCEGTGHVTATITEGPQTGLEFPVLCWACRATGYLGRAEDN